MIFLRTVFLGLLLTFSAPAAFAEFGERTLVTHPGFYHKQGPARAKGVIIWSPGSGSGQSHPKAKGGSMPHVLDWLYGKGWAVYYMQRTGSKAFSARPQHANALKNAVAGLRAAGYRNIVLAGQSSGGTYSMIAAKENLGLHAMILTGSGPSSGPLSFDRALRDALAGRFIVMHFAKDRTIGQRNRTKVEAALASKGIPYMNIHEPGGIEGHSGSYLSTFSKRFGDCLLRFIEPGRRPSGSECNGK